MKYYLIETDKNNPIPYKINSNQAVDIRDISRDKVRSTSLLSYGEKEKWEQIPMLNMVSMTAEQDSYFPDVFTAPFFMLTKDYAKVINLYENEIVYRFVKLFCGKNGMNASYYMPVLTELDCLAETSVLNNNKTLIERAVLNRNMIREKAIFRIRGFQKFYVIVRLDLMESLLKRGCKGIVLREVEIV